MKIRLPLLLVCLALCLGCQSKVATNAGPATGTANVEQLKYRMNDAFAALEMHAVDNKMSYPDSLAELVPKHLDAIPLDPTSGKPILYEKTDAGFRLSASGNYSEAGAEKGFPQMNQDGFYVMKEADFPKDPEEL